MAAKMGIGSAVEWYGSAQVLAGYDLHAQNRDAVYYSVWQGPVIKFVYTDGDEQTGRDLLAQNLQAWEQNGSSALYTLRFHPVLDKHGDLTNATPYNASGNFKMREAGGGWVSGVREPGPAPVQNDALEKIAQILAQQNERLTALENSEEDPEEDPEEEEEDPDAVTKIIAGIGNVEAAINESPMLGGLYQDLRGLLHVFMRKMGAVPQSAPAINGMEQQQQQQQKTVDIQTVMRELVAGFPELPGMLIKLHEIQQTDPVTFEFARKKLIAGIENLS